MDSHGSISEANQRSGLLFAGLCAVNGAFLPAVAKLTTERGDPLFVAAMTTLFAGLSAAFVLRVRGEFRQLLRRDVAPKLILLGCLGTVIPFLLFFEGARRTSAIETVLCLQIEPVYSLLVARLFLGHRLSARRIVAALVLVAGIVLAIGAGGAGDALGVGLLLVTPLSWQLSHLLVLRRLPGVEPHVLTGARYVYGGALLAPAAWALGGSTWMPAADSFVQQLPVLALQGIVLCFGGTVLWYQAIARLDLARATAIVVPSIPLLSLGASFLLVGEVPAAREVAGMLLIAAGVFSFVTAPHAVEARERVPAPTAPVAVPADPGTISWPSEHERDRR